MAKRKKQLNPDDKSDKKFNRRALIGFLIFIAIVAPLIWFVPRWLAEEEVIDSRNVVINEDTLTVIFSQKGGSGTKRFDKNNDNYDADRGPVHYGYFLELYDSVHKKSLDKIEFKSPVWRIQSTPELFVFESGIIWLVSTSQDVVTDEPGFILKFEIKNQKIVPVDFTLDEKYRIRDIKDNWVIITDGNVYDGMEYDPFSGCTYFDLETEEIVVIEPYGSEKHEPANPEDYMP